MNIEHAQLHMNIFDACILGILCLSAVVAFFRGFVREILSLFAWVGAGLITIYLFPQSTQFMKQHVKSENVAAGAAALGTYFAALITLSLINSIIIRYLKTGAEVGIIDNALGLVFGGLRGAFIVSLAYLLMSVVIPKENPPVWLKDSVTRPYLQQGAEIVAKISPRYLSNFEDIIKKQKENVDGQKIKDTRIDGQTVDDVSINPNGVTSQDINATKTNTQKAIDNLINTHQ